LENGDSSENSNSSENFKGEQAPVPDGDGCLFAFLFDRQYARQQFSWPAGRPAGSVGSVDSVGRSVSVSSNLKSYRHNYTTNSIYSIGQNSLPV
jgi:hypothetical protein